MDQDLGLNYSAWMAKIDEDAEAALDQFINILQKNFKRTKKERERKRISDTLKSANEVKEGAGFHTGARDLKEAVQFLVSNYLLKSSGLGVISNEDVVATVATIITEDVDFYPLTPVQKKLKAIAESYGLTVVVLN